MTKFERYKQEKIRLDLAKQWAALIGSSYSGGGGGVGYLHSATSTMEVYHQKKYNGSKNYHGSQDIPNLDTYLSKASARLGGSIIELALKMWSDDLSNLAAQAKLEYDELIKDAGAMECL